MTRKGETCIYCRNPAGSREHLMPRNLGGALIGTFLCRNCNTALGKLDQYLGEQSIVALPRLEKTQTFAAKMGGIKYAHFASLDDVAFSIVQGPATKLLPQIHITPNEDGTINVQYIGDESEYDGMRDVIQRQIDSDFRETSSEVRSKLKTLAIINHEGKKLRLRVPKAEHVDQVKDLLRLNLPEILRTDHNAEEIKAPSPAVRGQVGVNLKLLDRAVGKIAFNMMAYVYGPNFVLDPSFDDVRNFILKGEENDAVRVGPVEKDFLPIPAAANAEHEVMFFPMVGCTTMVTLYNTFRFLVWFPHGKVPEGVEEISSWTFSGQRDHIFDDQGRQGLEDILGRMGALD